MNDTHTTFDVPDGQFLFIEPIDTSEASSAKPLVIATFYWLQQWQAR
jgi:hypothetical protein